MRCKTSRRDQTVEAAAKPSCPIYREHLSSPALVIEALFARLQLIVLYIDGNEEVVAGQMDHKSLVHLRKTCSSTTGK